MKKIIQELETAITKYYALLKKTNDENFSKKPALNKWSKQEELGHLIDSAQNNIQRFIRVQYEENVHVRYHPDNWVIMNNYQNIEKNDVVELWCLLNKQVIAILEKMPSDKQEALMSFDVNPANKNTTLFIAEDYVQHLTHHLENIVSK